MATRRRGKPKYAFGFDPSINDPAWAVVGTDGSVLCGMVRNEYREPGRTKNWEKLSCMLNQLNGELINIVNSIPRVEVWVCEGQYCQRRGNQEHNVRLGWVSSMAYTFGEGRGKRIIAIPSTWTRNVPKEIRQPELLEQLQPEEEWRWYGAKPPPSLLHNIYDAIGLAQWGLQQEGLL